MSQSGLEVTFTIKPSSIKGGKEVEVYFNTELTTDAPLAQDVPNTSKLIYTNNIGTDSTFTKNSQTPTVHTGGYSLSRLTVASLFQEQTLLFIRLRLTLRMVKTQFRQRLLTIRVLLSSRVYSTVLSQLMRTVKTRTA